MNNKQLQLVTFEQAKRLEAIGFNWCDTATGFPSGLCYLPNGKLLSSCNLLIAQPELGCGYGRKDCIPAPTVALALQWMRDVRGFVTGIAPLVDSDFDYYRYGCWAGRCDCGGKQGLVMGYDRAESAQLDDLLTMIENT